MSAEFEEALASLASKGASASRIKLLTDLALGNARAYKEIVYAVERYLQKAGNRLSGLYLIDSIVKHASRVVGGGARVYVKRFEEKLVGMGRAFNSVPGKDREKVRKVVTLWRDNAIFTPAVIDAIEAAYFGVDNSLVEGAGSDEVHIDTPSEQSLVPGEDVAGTALVRHSNSHSTHHSPTRLVHQLPPPRIPSPVRIPSLPAQAPAIGVGALLASVMGQGTATTTDAQTLQSPGVPTMEQLNTLLKISSGTDEVRTVSDPAQFDYGDDEDEEVLPMLASRSNRGSVPEPKSATAAAPSLFAGLLNGTTLSPLPSVSETKRKEGGTLNDSGDAGTERKRQKDWHI